MAMARGQIAQDRVRFPYDHAVIVDDRDVTVRVHGPELGRIEAAELTARFDMPMFESQLVDQPHDLLQVEGTAPSPDCQHRALRSEGGPRPARPGRASAGLPAGLAAAARRGPCRAAGP